MKYLISISLLLISFQSSADFDPPIDMVSGTEHNCVLTKNNKVKCWGGNGDGQLGLGDETHRGRKPGEMGDNLPYVDLGSNLKISKIAAGSYHSCALFENGKVKCWGRNGDGQLGLGHNKNQGDDPGEMGDNLLYVDLGENVKVKKLSLGMGHSCVEVTNGKVKCWGLNSDGQLGLGDIESRGDNQNEMGENLPFVDFGKDFYFYSLKVGEFHSCITSINNLIMCWGYNGSGILGLGDDNHRGDEPGEMGENLSFIKFGNGLGVINLALGGAHSCALFKNEKLKCWGWNLYGQLGLEHYSNYGDYPSDMGENLPFVNLGLLK